MPSLSNLFIICLQVYFLIMNFTVERYYCLSDLGEKDDNRFLVPETIAFSKQNNPLFLAKPSWLHVATCISAFVFPIGYLFTLFVAFTNSWNKTFALAPILLFVGFKSYGIYYYHLMEFMSDMPPKNLIPYFSVEGPYIVSLSLCLYKSIQALNSRVQKDAKSKGE